MSELPTPLREKCDESLDQWINIECITDPMLNSRTRHTAEDFRQGFQSCWQEVEPIVRRAISQLQWSTNSLELTPQQHVALGDRICELHELLGGND